VNVANIDNLGNVHPDTMWWHHTLGNVRERGFGEIWNDVSDPLMAGLKAHPRKVGGRCGACAHFAICGGNTRVRAQQLTGDAWAEDPGCYLTRRGNRPRLTCVKSARESPLLRHFVAGSCGWPLMIKSSMLDQGDHQ
jgi:radical SAM protein with 4Fe4S-binding SPASM domain